MKTIIHLRSLKKTFYLNFPSRLNQTLLSFNTKFMKHLNHSDASKEHKLIVNVLTDARYEGFSALKIPQ